MGTGVTPSGSGSFSTSFGDISSGLFGESSTSTGASTSEKTGSTRTFGGTTEQLKIDEVGLLKLIEDSLKGVGGIAEIFGREKEAGLFGTSGAKKGTEDLLAKIAGELAKVTGTKVVEQDVTQAVKAKEETTSSQTQESEGILDAVGLGGIF